MKKFVMVTAALTALLLTAGQARADCAGGSCGAGGCGEGGGHRVVALVAAPVHVVRSLVEHLRERHQERPHMFGRRRCGL